MLRVLIAKLPREFRDQHGGRWRSLLMGWRSFNGHLKRLVRRPVPPENPDGSVNLHLGCGEINHPAFINVDGIAAPHVHYARRIDNLAPFADNVADLVYACHCLEHFSHRELARVLREWRRVLKPDGILRLSVPDFDLLLAIYQDNGRDLRGIIRPLMGGQEYPLNFHYSAFTCDTLSALLTEVGFREVRRWQPGHSALTTFDDWSDKRLDYGEKSYPVSLNLEALK